MYKSESFGTDFLEFYFPFVAEIHHCYPRAIPNPSRYRVLIHTAEPSLLLWDVSEVRKYYLNFDLILTSNKALLDLPNTKFLILGDKWIKNFPKYKDFSVSFLYSVGIRQPWNGYKLRDEIWKSRFVMGETAPLEYWYSSRRLPDSSEITQKDRIFCNDNKDIIFNSMFSIIIENISEENYFSEKIIDCFATMTIPIYFGCKNISKYFDISGIIFFDSLEELKKILSSLTADDYYKKMDVICKNFLTSREYWDGKLRLKSAILEGYLLK